MPSQQKTLIPVTKGFLKDYTTYDKIKTRREALTRVINSQMRKEKQTRYESAMEVKRALIARANLNKNRNPTVSMRMMRDANWVTKQYLE